VLGASHITLAELTCLKTITINLEATSRDLLYSGDLLHNLGLILETLPSPNTLQVVEIGEWKRPGGTYPVPGISPLPARLSHLDSILSGPKFCSFERLILMFEILTRGDDGNIFRYLPKLHHRQALQILAGGIR
jgi:hypothetical protein